MTYPLDLNNPLMTPHVPGYQKIKLSGQNQTAFSQSPFSGSEQVFEWPAEWWVAEVTLPPMARSKAEQWNAWALALRGRSGTLFLGDSGAQSPQGGLKAYPDLLRQTEAFDNSLWQKGGAAPPTVTANAVADPNSNLTADAINFAGGNVFGEIYQNTGGTIPVTGRTFTFSVYLRVPSGTGLVSLGLSDNIYEGPFSSPMTITSSWVRYSWTYTFVGPINYPQLLAIIGYSGTPAQTVYAWGAQIDRGASATTYSGVCNTTGPCVNGGGQTGKTLNISTAGILPNALILEAGDYIQVGVSSSQRLYKALTRTTTDGSGFATVNIFPRLRESPADATPIYWFDTHGTFRLADNLRGWDIDEARIYGLQFNAIEAI